MKVKLLKKVRKRFSWYIKTNGDFVVIDKKKIKTHFINTFYSLKYANLKEEELDVSKELLNWRVLKSIMLTPYGWSMDKSMFKLALKYSKRKNKKL